MIRFPASAKLLWNIASVNDSFDSGSNHSELAKRPMKSIFTSINCILVAIACSALSPVLASSPVPPTDSQQRAAHDAAAFLSGFARATKTTLVDSGTRLHLLKAMNQQQEEQPNSGSDESRHAANSKGIFGTLSRLDVFSPFGFHSNSHTFPSASSRANLPDASMQTAPFERGQQPMAVEPFPPPAMQEHSAPVPGNTTNTPTVELRPEIR